MKPKARLNSTGWSYDVMLDNAVHVAEFEMPDGRLFYVAIGVTPYEEFRTWLN